MCRTPLGLICTVWRPSWRMYPAREGQGPHTRDSSRKVRRYVQCTAGLEPCLVRQVGTANPTQLTLHQGVPSVCSVRMRGGPRLPGSDWPPTGRNPPDPSSQTTSLARAWRGSQASVSLSGPQDTDLDPWRKQQAGQAKLASINDGNQSWNGKPQLGKRHDFDSSSFPIPCAACSLQPGLVSVNPC